MEQKFVGECRSSGSRNVNSCGYIGKCMNIVAWMFTGCSASLWVKSSRKTFKESRLGFVSRHKVILFSVWILAVPTNRWLSTHFLNIYVATGGASVHIVAFKCLSCLYIEPLTSLQSDIIHYAPKVSCDHVDIVYMAACKSRLHAIFHWKLFELVEKWRLLIYRCVTVYFHWTGQWTVLARPLPDWVCKPCLLFKECILKYNSEI